MGRHTDTANGQAESTAAGAAYAIKLTEEDRLFLADYGRRLGGSRAGAMGRGRTIAHALRTLISACRTTFWLPPYMVQLLTADMQRRELDLFRYVQELLARRSEELGRFRSTARTDSSPGEPR